MILKVIEKEIDFLLDEINEKSKCLNEETLIKRLSLIKDIAVIGSEEENIKIYPAPIQPVWNKDLKLDEVTC